MALSQIGRRGTGAHCLRGSLDLKNPPIFTFTALACQHTASEAASTRKIPLSRPNCLLFMKVVIL